MGSVGTAAGATARPQQRSVLVLAVAATLMGAVVAFRVRPETLYDDAAITFRYAARLADGLGLTYNDGDRTGGASAPLYTLLLAAIARSGARPDAAAAVLSIPLFGGAVGMATWLACRIGGLVAGATAAVVLISGSVFQTVMLSGMESALAVVLGLGALLATSRGNTTVAAVLVGLAVVNRLDAGGLALAVLVAIGSVQHRVPWREMLVAGGVALPWFLFATWYLGSPIPFSATQKLAGRSGTWDADPTWVVRAVTGRHGAAVLLLAGASALLLAPGLRNRSWRAAAHLATLIWLSLHVAAYSLLDFGAPYPWYVTVAIPLAAVGAGVSLAALTDGAGKDGWMSLRGLVAVLVLGVLAVSLAPGIRSAALAVIEPPPERNARLLDATRAEAGRYVAERAAPDDVVRTCFGWVAYEAIDHRIDEVCPLNTRRAVPEATWLVDSPGPGGAPVDTTGYRRVATFERTGTDGVQLESIVYVRD